MNGTLESCEKEIRKQISRLVESQRFLEESLVYIQKLKQKNSGMLITETEEDVFKKIHLMIKDQFEKKKRVAKDEDLVTSSSSVEQKDDFVKRITDNCEPNPGTTYKVEITSPLTKDGICWVCCIGNDFIQNKIEPLSRRLRDATSQDQSLWKITDDSKLVCLKSLQHRLWVRGRIISRPSSSTVSVQLVDTGEVENCSVSCLSLVPEHLATIPYMAMQCCFDEKSVNYSYEARWCFSDLTKNQILHFTCESLFVRDKESYAIGTLETILDDPPVNISQAVAQCQKQYESSPANIHENSFQSRDVRMTDSSQLSNDFSAVRRVISNLNLDEEEIKGVKLSEVRKTKSPILPPIKLGEEIPIGESLSWGDCKTPDAEDFNLSFGPLNENVFNPDTEFSNEQQEKKQVSQELSGTHYLKSKETQLKDSISRILVLLQDLYKYPAENVDKIYEAQNQFRMSQEQLEIVQNKLHGMRSKPRVASSTHQVTFHTKEHITCFPEQKEFHQQQNLQGSIPRNYNIPNFPSDSYFSQHQFSTEYINSNIRKNVNAEPCKEPDITQNKERFVSSEIPPIAIRAQDIENVVDDNKMTDNRLHDEQEKKGGFSINQVEMSLEKKQTTVNTNDAAKNNADPVDPKKYANEYSEKEKEKSNEPRHRVSKPRSHIDNHRFESVSLDVLITEDKQDWIARELCNLTHQYLEHPKAQFFSVYCKEVRHCVRPDLIHLYNRQILYLPDIDVVRYKKVWQSLNVGPIFLVLRLVTEHEKVIGICQALSGILSNNEHRFFNYKCHAKFISTASMDYVLPVSHTYRSIDNCNVRAFLQILMQRLQSGKCDHFLKFVVKSSSLKSNMTSKPVQYSMDIIKDDDVEWDVATNQTSFPNYGSDDEPETDMSAKYEAFGIHCEDTE